MKLKKVPRVIKLNQKAQLKPYIDTYVELKKAKNDFEKYFFKLMNNTVFGKTLENSNNKRSKKELFGVRTKLSCNIFFFSKYLLVIQMKKICIYG